MRILAKNGLLFGVLVVSFGLIGCAGGAPAPAAPFGMGPQNYRIANLHSWIRDTRAASVCTLPNAIRAVSIFTRGGRADSSGRYTGGLVQPEGICADTAQNVYVVDSYATKNINLRRMAWARLKHGLTRTGTPGHAQSIP